MNKNDKNEFKASSVEDAIALGLESLCLTRENVDIEVKSQGGFFTKACVIIMPKAVEVAMAEPVVESKQANIAKEMSESISEQKTETAVEPISDAVVENRDISKNTQFVSKLINLMGLNCSLTTRIQENELVINLVGEDANRAIGYRGEVLDAIQYLTLLATNDRENGFDRISVDAESYRDKRRATLANLALRLASKASKSGSPVELEPMNPFERRVIHSTLQDSTLVTTTSEGEGRDRHVIIIPIDGDNTSANSEFKKKGFGKTRKFGYNNRRF